MLDEEGYRPNVGIVIVNRENKVFWGKRVKQHSWQFPQGGVNEGELIDDAMYRELKEEVGLFPNQVDIIVRTEHWIKYDVPIRWIKKESRDSYKGQKQIWYLLRFLGKDVDIKLRATNHPEFDGWRWNSFWAPVDEIIDFKKNVYVNVLDYFSKVLELPREKKGESF